jgi:hypothetical protein
MRDTRMPRRRHRARFISLLGCCVAATIPLSACTASNGGPSGGATEEDVTTSTTDGLMTRDVPQQYAATINDPVVTVDEAPRSGATSMPWAFISQDAAQLRIVYITGDGSCTQLAGVQVEQTDTSVSITVWSTTDQSQTDCPSTLMGGSGTVTLNAALGDRDLIHAPVSEQWAPLADQLS